MFTVRWKRVARDRLAELWLAAPDRAAVTQATHHIDQLLCSNPENKGESRDNGRRVLLVPPLGVVFRIRETDRVVEVLRVWSFK
jgi:hypothetical protein